MTLVEEAGDGLHELENTLPASSSALLIEAIAERSTSQVPEAAAAGSDVTSEPNSSKKGDSDCTQHHSQAMKDS